ncbi:MAG: Holliday junction resolvase RuvX [Candidatus Dormibacteraeota bacterium]|nr:Holliday junction resolvase RuvX [Candidatus Dormibacteraeota bacterium]
MAGRVLAVDPGTHRVGLALSDESQQVASPLRTVAAEPLATLAARLAEVAREVGAMEVVVGLATNLDGSRGDAARAGLALAEQLKRTTRLPVTLYDERLTSVAAERELIGQGVRRQRRRQVRDQMAATLILQGFLTRSGHGR